jgi:hypothetical protein
LNIFNVDFLGRNKNKEKKAAQKAAAAALAASNPIPATSSEGTLLKSKFSRNKKAAKQSATPVNNQPAPTTDTASSSNLNLINLNTNKDTGSLNSEDSNEQRVGLGAEGQTGVKYSPSSVTKSNNNANLVGEQLTNGGASNPGNVTARSISSITGSLSFDLLDQLKIANGGNCCESGRFIFNTEKKNKCSSR